jgi:hypothetical protein
MVKDSAVAHNAVEVIGEQENPMTLFLLNEAQSID